MSDESTAPEAAEQAPEEVAPPTLEEWFERVQKCHQMHGLEVPTTAGKKWKKAFADGLTAFAAFQAFRPPAV